MAMQIINPALDFDAPSKTAEAKAGHSADGFFGIFVTMLDALAIARIAEADYRIMVAHGISPAIVAGKAFNIA